MSSSTLGQRLSCKGLKQSLPLHVHLDGMRVETEKFTSRGLMVINHHQLFPRSPSQLRTYSQEHFWLPKLQKSLLFPGWKKTTLCPW